MKFGIVPTEGGYRLAESLEEVLLAEELGFDSAWLSEHHGVRDHYWGTPLLGLAAYATRTSRITIGSNVIILPLHHPVRVAEEAVLLDTLSGGRFILGVGMGYREDEFRMFGVDHRTKGGRYEEALQILRRLLDGERVDFAGRFFRVSGVALEPRPARRIPLWAGGWGVQNLRRAATFADAWLPGPTADLDRLLACQELYRQWRQWVGKPQPEARPLTRELIIAPTEAAAREAAARYLLANYRDEYAGGWGHPLFSDDPDRAADLDRIGADRFLVGSPESVVKGIRRFAAVFGADEIIFRLYARGTPHDFIMDELRLLAREVLPAFPRGDGVRA